MSFPSDSGLNLFWVTRLVSASSRELVSESPLQLGFSESLLYSSVPLRGAAFSEFSQS